MPKVSDQYRRERRAEIAGAALRCFARSGFDGTSIADIIAESGLSAGAIYGHFTSKTEIIHAAVAELLSRRVEDVTRVMNAPHPDPPGDLIAKFLKGLRTEVGGSSVLVQLWASASTNLELRRLAAGIATTVGTAFTQYLSAWYRKEGGLSPNEADYRARREATVCIGLTQGYIVQSAIFEGFDGDAYLAAVSELFAR
ncbi:MAG: TetR/AcrR family transcriptional regulator [Terrimesophilobacter sp.]